MRKPERKRCHAQSVTVASWLVAPAILLAAGEVVAAPSCPIEAPAINAAKSHKLYLYFPTADDPSYPNFATGTTPADHFDAAQLSPGIGTTAQLRDRIHDVVVDDYCEFDVQVLETTTNPDNMASPPALRHTVAIGSDANGGAGAWGVTQVVANPDVNHGRVWGGAYVGCEGGDGNGGCSMEGALTGANATLDHWAQAIGGTAAHEGGHTYGLAHTDDDPPGPTNCGQNGAGPAPGEDAYTRHLMPAGCYLDGDSRTQFRRHISDNDYGILATNVGLSIETMHNWDLVNPNAQAGRSLAIDFLSQKPSISVDWFWNGSSSPWINPTVSGPMGTATFHGQTYNRYRITWTTPNPAWGGASGTVSGGGQFHIGATFTGVDFNTPEPIIIQNVTLFDAGMNALALHPRLPIYDAGSVDSASDTFNLHFIRPPGPLLRLVGAEVMQLPRVASINSMTGEGRPYSFDKQPIRPWSVGKCAPQYLREQINCTVARLDARPHVLVVHKLGEPNVYDCSKGPPTVGREQKGDNRGINASDGPACAGAFHDPFPSTTVYVIATFVDVAKHWDPAKKAYVVGPVESKVFYQFAGVRKLERRDPPPTAGY